MSTNVFFTRHGETVWNTKKLMQGWKDSPLTNRGMKQAQQLSQRLSGVPLNAIYSSTSNRAIDTAEIIKRDRPCDVIKMESLRELSFGIWEGKTFEENQKEYPDEWLSFWETPHLFSYDEVEPFVKVQERMINVVKDIVKAHPYENICIVTHSIALKLLINHFEEIPLEKLWSSPAIPSTSLTMAKVSYDSHKILYKYDTSHMTGIT